MATASTIHQNDELLAQARKFWELLQRTNEQVEETEFIKIYCKVYRASIPDMDEEALRLGAKLEWKKETLNSSSGRMDINSFYHWIQKIAFYNTLEWTVPRWITFLQHLFKSITTRTITYEDGQVETVTHMSEAAAHFLQLASAKKLAQEVLEGVSIPDLTRDELKQLYKTILTIPEARHAYTSPAAIPPPPKQPTSITSETYELADDAEISFDIHFFHKTSSLAPALEEAERERQRVCMRDSYYLSKDKYASLLAQDEFIPPIRDEYDHDEAEERFVRTPPVSFLILGKDGNAKKVLGRQLAAQFNCVHLDVETLTALEYAEQSEHGKEAAKLVSTKALPFTFQSNILTKHFYSSEARHRGYVYDYYPILLENELHEFRPKYVVSLDLTSKEHEYLFHKPVPSSSSSSQPDEWRRNLVKSIVNSQQETVVPSHAHMSKAIQEIISYAKANNRFISVEGTLPTEDIFNCVCMHMNLVAPVSLATRPQFPDEVKGDDQKLRFLLFSPENLAKGLRLSSVWKKYCPVKFLEENTITEGSMEFCVIYRTHVYLLSSERAMKKFIANPHDYLALPPSAKENPQLVPQPEAISWDDIAPAATTLNMVKMCPVCLKESHNLIPGSTKFCARFKSTFYLLRGETEFTKFMQNPHIYAVTEVPSLPPPKIYIVGTQCSGKSTHASYLSEKYGVPIVRNTPEFFQEVSNRTGFEKIKEILADPNYFNKKVQQPQPLPQADGELAEGEEENPPQEEPSADQEEEDQAAKQTKRNCLILREIVSNPYYTSSGFILDGAPANKVEADILLGSNDINLDAFPNAVIVMKNDLETAKKRILPGMQKKVEEERIARLHQKRLKQQQKEEARKKRRLDEEEPEEEEEEETPLATKEQLVEELAENFSSEMESLNELVEHLKTMLGSAVPIVELPGTTKPVRVINALSTHHLRRFLDDRAAMFETTRSVPNLQTAFQLLRNGEVMLSSYGYQFVVELARCIEQSRYYKHQQLIAMDPKPKQQEPETTPPPVAEEKNPDEGDSEDKPDSQAGDGNNEEDEEGTKKRKNAPPPLPEKAFAAIYRNFIYFFKSAPYRDEFLLNPFKFLAKQQQQHKPSIIPPHIAPRISVITGAAGATSLEDAKSFATELGARLGAVVLELNDMLTFTAEETPTELGERVKAELNSGKPIPTQLFLEVLKRRTSYHDCQQKGYILVGFPSNLNEVTALEQDEALTPHKVFMLVRATNSNNNTNNGGGDVSIESAMSATASTVKQFYEREHRNIITFNLNDTSVTRWKMLDTASSAVLNNLYRRQIYAEYCSSVECRDRPCPIYDLGITPANFKAKLSRFEAYCVVDATDNKWLTNMDHDTQHRYAVEYKDKYWVLGSEEAMNKFIANPTFYTSSTAYTLLAKRPRRILDPTEAAKIPEIKIALKGFDPVLLQTLKDKEPICTWGDNQFCVEYDGKYYKMATENQLKLFMREPWKYVNSKLPSKLPVRKEDWPSLSIIQYLEETCQKVVTQGLIETHKLRPKFPYLSARESALKYLAVYLKAHNPSNSPQRAAKYEQNLKHFVECCELIPYIHSSYALKEEQGSFNTKEWNDKVALFDNIRSIDLHSTFMA